MAALTTLDRAFYDANSKSMLELLHWLIYETNPGIPAQEAPNEPNSIIDRKFHRGDVSIYRSAGRISVSVKNAAGIQVGVDDCIRWCTTWIDSGDIPDWMRVYIPGELGAISKLHDIPKRGSQDAPGNTAEPPWDPNAPLGW
jgi:hypothetical protein